MYIDRCPKCGKLRREITVNGEKEIVCFACRNAKLNEKSEVAKLLNKNKKTVVQRLAKKRTVPASLNYERTRFTIGDIYDFDFESGKSPERKNTGTVATITSFCYQTYQDFDNSLFKKCIGVIAEMMGLTLEEIMKKKCTEVANFLLSRPHAKPESSDW